MDSGKSSNRPSQNSPFDPLLLDHAIRCWDAERENANRLSARSTWLLSAMAAIFTLGLFRIDWLRGEHDQARIHSVCCIWVIKGCLCLGLLLFAFAFYRVVAKRATPIRDQADNKPHASDHLALPAHVFSDPAVTHDDLNRLIFTRTYKAYLSLQTRNAFRKQAQDDAQKWLLLGLSFIALAILTYILSSEPPIR